MIINNKKGCQLTEGDLIKLGRIKMRVVEQRALGKPARKAEVEMGRRAGTVRHSLWERLLMQLNRSQIVR